MTVTETEETTGESGGVPDSVPSESELALVIEAWPSLADTAIASMSFQIGKESIRPIHEEKRAGSMRQLFVFSSTETALFIDAMLSDHTVTVRWRHDDGHADERTITVTGFEARREYFEICKSRIAE